MEPDFWKQRWAEGKIGFHEGSANAFLVEYGARLSGRVLVPLCGKAEDVAYLASRGHEVVGVELVENAVAAFFAEHELAPSVDEPWNDGTHRVYRCGGITLIAGDWFGVTRELLGVVDSIYDRAALVALPAEMRGRYIAHMKTAVAEGTPGLLVSLVYDQAKFEGPPFSVDDAEVYAHYASVELLAERPVTDGRIGEANIGAVARCYTTTL